MAADVSPRASVTETARPALLVILLAGAALRASWLTLGMWALTRLRRESEPADLGGDVEVVRRAVAPRADLRLHDRLSQPVTFGWRRPVVLLPRSVADLSPDAQRAVVCHELLHVARHDWAWTLVDETLRCAFWFHPAMWWALAQLELSREQVVDEQVVRLTDARAPYMKALVMFAGDPAARVPALPFIRRRHLVSRIRQLSEEHTMSSLRTACAAAASIALVLGAGWSAASGLPLRSGDIALLDVPSAPAPIAAGLIIPAPQASRTAESAPASDETGGAAEARIVASRIMRKIQAQAQPASAPAPRATQRVAPEYPIEAAPRAVEAVVTLHVDVDTNGQVTNVSVVGTRLTTERDIDDPAYWASQPSRAFAWAAEAAASRWLFDPPAAPVTVEVAFVFVPRQAVAAYRYGQPGSTRLTLPSDTIVRSRSQQAPPAPVAPDRSQPGVGAPGSPTPGVAIPVAPPAGPPIRVRVGGTIRQPSKIWDVRPEYPEAAKAARVAGVVIVETVIATDGSVSETTVMRSIPLLDQAAVDAVRQWRFTPTLLNGQPVEVVVMVTVNFALSPD